ncbi:MAG: hypothetical protein Ct9H300mP14_10320 [Gammaproteobacteria bacterium]|nr:MAG: hypothetical protein Ct9H300mP14_10320 [Gammaproteobacteria bacterium]
MEIALLYVAGAVLLGLAGVGVGVGVGCSAHDSWKDRPTARTSTDAQDSVFYCHGFGGAIPIIGVAIALYIMFAVWAVNTRFSTETGYEYQLDTDWADYRLCSFRLVLHEVCLASHISALNERKTRIADGLAAADEGQREKARAEEHAAEVLEEAKGQAQEIIREQNDARQKWSRKLRQMHVAKETAFSLRPGRD